MKKYTHGWVALMAIKRLEKVIPQLNEDDQEKATNLIKYLKENNDGVVQGAWFPDSIIHDNSTGHIWQLRVATKNEPHLTGQHNLPSSLFGYKKIKKNLKKLKIFHKRKTVLPDRCQALSYAIRDQLKITHKVGGKKYGAGSAIVPTNNEVALNFFMLSHYIADAHMPLHCDARAFDDRIHGIIETYWEKQINEWYKPSGVKGQDKRFLLDVNGYPKLHKTENFENSMLGILDKKLESSKFTKSLGSKNSNVYDYMADVCYFSYLLSITIIDKEITKSLSVKKFKEKYAPEYEKRAVDFLFNAIDSTARVWLKSWKDFEESK